MARIKTHAYWIHKKVKDESSFTGYMYLPQCTCSNCGYESNMAKPVCPSCGAIMDKSAPADAEDDQK